METKGTTKSVKTSPELDKALNHISRMAPEAKKPPKKIVRDEKHFLRRNRVHAQIVSLPRHEPTGTVEAQISSIDLLSSTNHTTCKVKFYGGSLILELESSNARMVFTTDSIEDTAAIEHGIHQVRRKMRRSKDK